MMKTIQENSDKEFRIAHTPEGFTDSSVKQPVSSPPQHPMCPNSIVDNREGAMDHSNAKNLSSQSDYFDRETAGFFRREQTVMLLLFPK